MTSHDVYLTRHGARIDKEDRGWLAKAGHGRSDDPHLSSAGEQAAEELAAHLSTGNIQHIVCSPFFRCLQTAAPVARRLGLPIKVEYGICEILLQFPPGLLEPAALRAAIPDPGLPEVQHRHLAPPL